MNRPDHNPKNRSNKRKNTKGASKAISVFVVMLSVGCVIFGFSRNPDIEQNKKTIAQLEQQLKYEQQRADAVDDLAEKAGTDEYYEAVARNKLGMIKKDEIIFKETSGDN